MDPLKQYQQGEVWTPTASWLNAVNEAANLVRARPVFRQAGDTSTSLSQVLVKNVTADVVDRYGILSLSGQAVLITPDDGLDAFQEQVAIEGDAPGGAGEIFVVLLEPLGEDEIGHAAIAGAVQVQIDVTDAGHAFAQTDAADTDKLVSAASAAAGTVPILWKESGTGTKWAVVLLPPSQGSGSSTYRDQDYYHHIGESGSERWYACGMPNTSATQAFANLSTNTFLAMAFLDARGGTIEKLGILVTTAAGAGKKARLGIYDSISDTNLHPNNLIVDGGEIDIDSIGFKTVTINQTLEAGKLYWFASLSNDTAIVIGWAGGGLWRIFGGNSAFNSERFGWVVTHTYSALPATFPTAIMKDSSNLVEIVCNFSS